MVLIDSRFEFDLSDIDFQNFHRDNTFWVALQAARMSNFNNTKLLQQFLQQLPPAIRLVQTFCWLLLPFKVKPSVQPQNKDLASKKAVKPDTEISSLISQLVNSRCPCIAVTDHTVRLIILFLTLQVLQQRAVKSPCGLITPRNENATTWWQ